MYNFERSPKRCVMQMGGWILLYMAPSPYIEPSFYHLQIELSPHMLVLLEGRLQVHIPRYMCPSSPRLRAPIWCSRGKVVFPPT